MIPQDTVDRILDTVRIEDIIGDFVTLKRRGANYMACCPFHNEKTPSFSVSPSKGIYKCFGCGKSGSAVTFLMDYDNMTYPEALKYIAKKYGIEIVEEEESPEILIAKQRKESLILVSEFAGKFFKENLKSKEGRAVGYSYFKARGLEDETIDKFGLGWSLSDRHALAKAAREAGYKEDYLIDTGLCTKYDDGSLGDRFHDRAMFPIHSVSGRIIAFGGRTLKTDKSVAKYVNSRETEIYVKNQSLYGIWFAKNSISKLDRCILVEGYLDVISMHQKGITNVVASSGTSLTDNQVRLIRRFTENVTIIYDGDSAGINAALRGIGLVLEGGLNVKVVLLPDGDDPDSFAQKHDTEEIESFIEENSQDFIAFKTDILLGQAKNDPIKKANVINEIADTIALIPDAVKRTVYVNSCAEAFGVEPDIIFERMKKSHDEKIMDKARRARSEQQRTDGEGSNYNPTPSTDNGANKPMIGVGPLDPNEKEILSFILNNGTSVMKFNVDSPYYSEEPADVASFIDCALAEDSIEFHNAGYRKVYEKYFELYEAGYEQDKIRMLLLNSADIDIAAIVSDLTIEKYDITVEAYRNSLTTEGTILVNFVPKAILLYKKALLEQELEEEMLNLENVDEDGLMAAMQSIQEKTKLKNIICDELGRVC